MKLTIDSLDNQYFELKKPFDFEVYRIERSDGFYFRVNSPLLENADFTNYSNLDTLKSDVRNQIIELAKGVFFFVEGKSNYQLPSDRIVLAIKELVQFNPNGQTLYLFKFDQPYKLSYYHCPSVWTEPKPADWTYTPQIIWGTPGVGDSV